MFKVLIVENMENTAALIANLMTKNGFDVVLMNQSAGLMLRVKLCKPDIILLSGDIPGESGFDACIRLKADSETSFIPVVLLLDSDSRAAQYRAVEVGAEDYVAKNAEGSLLLMKIKALLRIKTLSDELKQKYAELEEKNAILSTQLKMAVNVQRSLIRDFDFEYNNVRFFSRYLPALEIGGDFYDIIKLDNEFIAVVIGDVSGHGISASLLTAMLNMMIQNMAPKYYNPGQFLYHMNNDFSSVFEKSNSQMYACMFYAVIDTSRRRIYYSNAGQSLPIFVSMRDKSVFELDAAGSPVGLLPNAGYETKLIEFAEHDLCLFYTDGLSDNNYKHNNDDFFEIIKSKLIFSDESVNETAEAILDTFYHNNARGSNKFDLDDVSMILCKF